MCVPSVRYGTYWTKEYPLLMVQNDFLNRKIAKAIFTSLLAVKLVMKW
jgi:hypothetical protein